MPRSSSPEMRRRGVDSAYHLSLEVVPLQRRCDRRGGINYKMPLHHERHRKPQEHWDVNTCATQLLTEAYVGASVSTAERSACGAAARAKPGIDALRELLMRLATSREEGAHLVSAMRRILSPSHAGCRHPVGFHEDSGSSSECTPSCYTIELLTASALTVYARRMRM